MTKAKARTTPTGVEGASGSHDELFKFVFSRPRLAAAELRLVLPPELSARLGWRSLRLLPGSFVDERLKTRHSDLLFSVPFDGKKALLYLLFEHQSRSDPLMPFRMLRYMVQAWDAFLVEHPAAKRLPAIIPVVLHHDRSGWSAPIDLLSIIDLDGPALDTVTPYVPQFRLLLDDIGAASDEALRNRRVPAMVTATLVMLARARTNPDPIAELRRWTDVLEKVAKARGGVAILAALWQYALDTGAFPPDRLRRFVHQLGPAAEEAYMTAAQILTRKVREKSLAEGRAKGRAEGRAEGEAKAVLRILQRRRIPIAEKQRARILACTDLRKLETWLDRALVASSANEVLG